MGSVNEQCERLRVRGGTKGGDAQFGERRGMCERGSENAAVCLEMAICEGAEQS